MEHNSPQKIKLLKIWEILNQKTDSEHPMTTQELINELAEQNISCERRALYRDIVTLKLNGYEVLTGRSGHDKTYYVKNRQFDIPEIKIIMDAVQSAAFIPEDKTDVLLDKLASLSGGFRAKLLKLNAVHFQTAKYNNSDIYTTVELIETAIEKHRRISFYYYQLDESGNRVYKHNKLRYSEEPIGMIFDDSHYYLLCYRSEDKYENNVKTFRIDRMDCTIVSSEIISDDAVKTLKKVKSYRLQAFKMFDGDIQKVTLKFDASLIGVVFDKFGNNTKIRRDKDICYATVQVQISPTFWGWMLQNPTKMKIAEPEQLREEYLKWVQSALVDDNGGII